MTGGRLSIPLVTSARSDENLLDRLNLYFETAVADTPDTIYVVVPYAAREGELSDADLEKVAGGKQDITANCTVGGAGLGNTVTQLNLG